MDPLRDPVRVRDGAVVAVCRACANEPEPAHEATRSINCVCGAQVELWRSSTAVVDGAVVALCSSCARDGVAASPPRAAEPSQTADDERIATPREVPDQRRRGGAIRYAAAAVVLGGATAIVIYMRAGSGAASAESDTTDAAPALAAVTTVISAAEIEHELPPTATNDDPAPLVESVVTEAGKETATVIVPIHLLNSDQSAKFAIPIDGRLDEAAAETVAEFLGCRQSGLNRPIAPQLLAILADLADHFNGHTIEVISAYRATPGEPKTSPHLGARAADLRVIGVSLEKVRDYVWANHRAVGLGYYPHSKFLHVDYRPARERIAWTQARLGSENHYHPPWSLSERDRRKAAEAPTAEAASNEAMDNR